MHNQDNQPWEEDLQPQELEFTPPAEEDTPLSPEIIPQDIPFSQEPEPVPTPIFQEAAEEAEPVPQEPVFQEDEPPFQEDVDPLGLADDSGSPAASLDEGPAEAPSQEAEQEVDPWSVFPFRDLPGDCPGEPETSQEPDAWAVFPTGEDPLMQEPELLSQQPAPETAEPAAAALSQEEAPQPVPSPQPEDQPSQSEPEDQEYRDNLPPEPPAPKKRPGSSRNRNARKGRPKKTAGEGLWGIPSILSTVVWLVLIVAIGVTAGRMAWVCASDVLAFGREDKVVTITVYEKDTMEDITEKLYNAGLIRYRSLFNLYATFSHAEEDIKPGIYDLNTRYDYHALVNFMTPSSNRSIIKVMIPEGYSSAQIFALLEENKVCTAVDLANYAASGELNEYWFLEDVERGQTNCLEGFLFPDTYEFYKNDSPRNILQKMLTNFDNRFDEELRGQIDSLNQYLSGLMRSAGRSEDYIASHLFTVREVAIVASMIEKETAHSGESPLIASVIYNRLFNWGDNPAYLNIDAAIVYALGGKTNLTKDDLKVDSPYNTYLNTGLTPTPIANPGLTSLKAALNPEHTNYYFYVLDPNEGSHQFSTSREEHEANVARFSAPAQE